MAPTNWNELHDRMHRIFDKMTKGTLKKKVDKDWLAGVHRCAVRKILSSNKKHKMLDSLDRMLPYAMIEKSEQTNILWGDMFFKERDFLIQALTTQNASVLIPQKIAKKSINWAFYITPPHGSMIWRGSKSLIVKSMLFKNHTNTPLLLISGDNAYGIIQIGNATQIDREKFERTRDQHKVSEKEAHRLGFDKKEILYTYKVDVIHAYPEPIAIDKPKGMQTFAKLSEVRVPNSSTRKSIEFGERELDNMFFHEDKLSSVYGF